MKLSFLDLLEMLYATLDMLDRKYRRCFMTRNPVVLDYIPNFVHLNSNLIMKTERCHYLASFSEFLQTSPSAVLGDLVSANLGRN